MGRVVRACRVDEKEVDIVGRACHDLYGHSLSLVL